MSTYLEHANLTVPDIDAAIEFLRTVDPQFEIRHDGTPEDSNRWVHIGIGDTYFALSDPHPGSTPRDRRNPYHDFGINHLGLVVDDLDSVIERLEAAGYREGIEGEENSFRRRAYYYDSADFEWELVEYLTGDPAERFSY